jgi:hypothetical protein
MNTPSIFTPPEDLAAGRVWAALILILNIVLVTTFVVHWLRSGSGSSLLYAILGGSATLTWFEFRQESREAARVADTMVLPIQFFLMRLASPAMDWLGW